MIGKTVSHYEIISKLGEGGMGEVYLARDTKLGRDVALKILPPDLASDAERRTRFEREARAIAALKHPNIVTLYSVEEADGVLFITMEHVEGGTLGDEIVKDGLSLSRFFDTAIPLADALATAHEKGIAHRDIKPSNVMRDAAGRIKVLDFGLAKLFESDLHTAETLGSARDSVTAEGAILGTVAYMSPEQAEGQSVDARSDVFSLGVVLYELATGKRPFQGKTNISTISAILKDDPPSVSALRPVVPRHLGRIISRCLAKDPSRRYQSALDVRNELESLKRETTSGLSAGEEIHPGARSVGGGVPRWIPWAAGIAVLAVIALFGLQQLGGGANGDGANTAASPQAVTADERRRIVVFPFENLGDAGDAYFAAGITEEITSRLAGVSDLSVMSRSSAAQYDRAGKTVKQIGEELEVDYVLEGSVRWEKRGDATSRVRVTPQLIRTADDSHVWADSYDRSMDEIFRVQTEIAEQVVGRLNVALAPADQEALQEKLTDNIDAWHAYQRGRVTSQTGDMDSRETHELMVAMFQRAVEHDPQFHRGYVELAVAHAGFSHWEIDRSEERLAMCKAAVDRAFEIEPDSPWSYMARGYYHYHGKKEYESAWQAFTRAQQGLPREPEVYVALASVRRRQARFQDALDYFEKAAELAPRDVYSHVNAGETASYVLGDYERGHRYFEQAVSLSPQLRLPYSYDAMVYLYEGDAENAIAKLTSCPTPPITDNDFVAEFRVLYCVRDFDAALKSVSAASTELVDEQFHLVSRSLCQGLVYQHRGEEAAAEAAFERARTALEARVRELPDDARSHAKLGLAYALLGRAEDAIREGKYAVEIYPPSVDAYIAPARVADLANIYAVLGENDRALDHLETIVGIAPHYMLAPGWLKLHPYFDGMRDMPRFQALLSR